MVGKPNQKKQKTQSKLIHGGQLNQQVRHYNIPREHWLDLSTGISPFSYPSDQIPKDSWQRLPERSVEFDLAVTGYYQTQQFVACHGSQAAIQWIPTLWASLGNLGSKIWLPKVGYKEHQNYWQQANFDYCLYSDLPSSQQLKQHSVVVVINPNNPSAKTFSQQRLLTLAKQLEQKCGLLVVDEAFIESSIEQSITPFACEFENLIVLRSIGKFFGLAGARVGFVFSSAKWLDLLESAMGQWPVSGPALWLIERALKDTLWQRQQFQTLTRQSQKLAGLLEQQFKSEARGTILFRVISSDKASLIFDALCRQGIYVRLLDDLSGLRFGVTDDAGLERLRLALEHIIDHGE